MSQFLLGPRALIAAAILTSLSLAPAAAAPPSSASTGCTAGQAELKPLLPVTLVTDRGRFTFHVELADTFEKRETGLMCRTRLAPDRGMLFDFKRPEDNIAFWMRNTLIPLDIVFIRTDGRVLSIAHNAHPKDDTPLPAGGAVRGVLEIAGGRAAQLDLMPGDKVLSRIFPK
ncbi:MAG: hypothetical protein JWQ97_807 [Phenylobacterium sp.]|nr:hypothetical protein [Phenylobacterium sp.]